MGLLAMFTVATASLAGATASFGTDSTVHSSTSAVSRPWLNEIVDPADARHLLGRTGFGHTSEEIISLIGLTRQAAIDLIIDELSMAPALPPPVWTAAPAPRLWQRDDFSVDQRTRFDRARDREVAQLRQWWVNTMLRTEHPQAERLVLFWHDHFATSYHGLDQLSIGVARQLTSFREHGFGNFRDFLKTMLRDPALMQFLDAQINSRDAPNENLARELLELFVLGEGHYSEQDVREAARALTGIGFSDTHDLAYRFRSWDFDDGLKEVLGTRTRLDAEGLVDVLLAQPEAAAHIARAFWHGWISDKPPPSETLSELADQFRQAGYEVPVLYRSVLESEAFWSSEQRAALVKSPVDLVIGTARTLDFPKRRWQAIPSMLASLGMDLFAPPNVAGWSEGEVYITPGRLASRIQWLDEYALAASATEHPPYGDESLVIRLAAEDYQGAPHFAVSLHEDSRELWRSASDELDYGHDTQSLGRIRGRVDLPWQDVAIDAPPATLKRATQVRVHFLNDAAGDDGDRNLYVDGFWVGERWWSANLGIQTGECVSENPADAGLLACAGHVSVAVDNADRTPLSVSDTHMQLASAHVRWGRLAEAEDPPMLHIAVSDVSLPDGRLFDTLSFRLVHDTDGGVALRIDSFDCLPDCIDHWPDCAWRDDQFQAATTLSFRRNASPRDGTACHFDALSDASQQLVASLWQAVPALLVQVRDTARGESYTAEIDYWISLLKRTEHARLAARYQSAFWPLQVMPQPLELHIMHERLPPPPVRLQNLQEWEGQVSDNGLEPAQVLLPGVDVRGGSVEVLLTHPLYQLR